MGNVAHWVGEGPFASNEPLRHLDYTNQTIMILDFSEPLDLQQPASAFLNPERTTLANGIVIDLCTAITSLPRFEKHRPGNQGVIHYGAARDEPSRLIFAIQWILRHDLAAQTFDYSVPFRPDDIGPTLAALQPPLARPPQLLDVRFVHDLTLAQVGRPHALALWRWPRGPPDAQHTPTLDAAFRAAMAAVWGQVGPSGREEDGDLNIVLASWARAVEVPVFVVVLVWRDDAAAERFEEGLGLGGAMSSASGGWVDAVREQVRVMGSTGMVAEDVHVTLRMWFS